MRMAGGFRPHAELSRLSIYRVLSPANRPPGPVPWASIDVPLSAATDSGPTTIGRLAGYSDHHYARLGAKPGITGLWQVNGRSSVVNFEEVVRMDREYIDRWSLWLDLTILARTVPAVVRRTGAY